MKIQIIPDVHTRIGVAESMIDEALADHIVFLGDYFDSLDDSPEIAYQVAEWLKQSLYKPNRTHLIGNHDVSYMTNGSQACSGWTSIKQFFVNKVNVPWNLMKEYCWVDNWLCTHAGLTNGFYNSLNFKKLDVNDFLEDMIENYPYRYHQCSPYRGGRDAYSGIFWCDYEEFEDIPNVKQIFGHTHGDVRITNNHICIDTWLTYYALYDTDLKEMKVVKHGGIKHE